MRLRRNVAFYRKSETKESIFLTTDFLRFLIFVISMQIYYSAEGFWVMILRVFFKKSKKLENLVTLGSRWSVIAFNGL